MELLLNTMDRVIRSESQEFKEMFPLEMLVLILRDQLEAVRDCQDDELVEKSSQQMAIFDGLTSQYEKNHIFVMIKTN